MSRGTCRLPGCPSLAICLVGLACMLPRPAGAQEAVPVDLPAFVTPALVALVPSEAFIRGALTRVEGVQPIRASGVGTAALRRPAALPALYISFATLQALDVHSTLTAVDGGRIEANPAMKGLVGQPAAFVAAKIAATAATFYISERLWRRHRVGAVVLMVAVNGAYAAIVATNYRR
jgi:hypothetical protein